MMIPTPYLFALGANLAFATASVAFSHFARQVSPLWMNAFKATVALLAFGLAYALVSDYKLPSTPSLIAFLVSGFIGLNIGDWFLMRAFASLGAARAIMLFGLQPMILGVAGIFLFNQPLPLETLIALVFLFGCLFVFSLEGFQQHGRWDIKGLLIGIVAISLDASGVLLTRWAFDQSTWIDPVEGNFFRCVGAGVGFFVLSFFRPLQLVPKWLGLPSKQRILILIASLSGTFLSLFLYLSAVREGQLAIVSGIAITGPLFAGIVECLTQRKWPSPYLVCSFILFTIGFGILVIYTH